MPLYLYPTASIAFCKTTPAPARRRATHQQRAKTTMPTKDDHVAAMKTQLDAWSAEIDALEAKAHEVTQDAKVQYEEQLDALRAKYQEGDKKLREMRLASHTAWGQVQAAGGNAWAALKDSAHAFQVHFRS